MLTYIYKLFQGQSPLKGTRVAAEIQTRNFEATTLWTTFFNRYAELLRTFGDRATVM